MNGTMNNKIDFVITWVDGSDREWQRLKNSYLPGREDSHIDASGERYRDWGLLPYWFRAAEQYAPWVNKVHFVSCGQVPDWLNLSAPKLHLVSHEVFIPPDYLPTFNSNAIELNLHRIPGLGDQFVYFNDDFFLAAPTRPEDFFIGGLPCDCIEERPPEFCERILYNHIVVNDIIFANRHFERLPNRKEHRALWYSLNTPHISFRNLLMGLFRCRHFFGLNVHHLPQAYRKQTFSDVWEAEAEWMDETCRNRFRSESDMSHASLKYWQLLKGDFHPYNKRKFGRVFRIGEETADIISALGSRQYKAICLSDEHTIKDFEETKARLMAAFEETFPRKSSFER